jgi:hydroxymethylglutaryl-CoA lyase
MPLPSRVRIVDVGPRDGLQNEKQMIPADIKVELVDRLTDAGFDAIEVASFVSPKWVPQMSDGADVMARIRRKPGVVYSVLVPNLKGFEGALAAKADEIVVFGSASEAFSQKNINCSIAESIERFRPVVAAARQHGMHVRGAISCALGCPYQGEVGPDAVKYVAQLMHEIGVQHIGVADTIGVGTPEKTKRAMAAALQIYELADVSGHFSRHLWRGDRQRVCLPRTRHRELRHQHRRTRWLSVCQGGDRQCRDGGCAVPAARAWHRNGN